MSDARQVDVFWDEQADRYDRAFETASPAGRALRSRQEAVLSLLGNGPGELLDAGMGPGRLLVELSKRGWRVSGADSSKQMVALARGRLPHARGRLLRASVERLPFRQSSFDAVAAIGVLEYTGYSPAAISELARVLRPGGLAVLSVPDPSPFARLWRRGIVYPLSRALKQWVPVGRPAPPWRPPPPKGSEFDAKLAAAGLVSEPASPVRAGQQLLYAARKGDGE